VLQEFWVYCQPVDLYACLAGRLRSNVSVAMLMLNSTTCCVSTATCMRYQVNHMGRCCAHAHVVGAQPVCLSRTLCYHREAARTPASVHGHAGSLRLELGGLSSTPLSVVAALCHKTEASVRASYGCHPSAMDLPWALGPGLCTLCTCHTTVTLDAGVSADIQHAAAPAPSTVGRHEHGHSGHGSSQPDTAAQQHSSRRSCAEARGHHAGHGCAPAGRLQHPDHTLMPAPAVRKSSQSCWLPCISAWHCRSALAATAFHCHPAEDHQDLRHLKPRQGAPMTSRLQPHLAFGLIPAEAAVLCGSVSIDSQRLELQHFVSLDKVGCCHCMLSDFISGILSRWSKWQLWATSSCDAVAPQPLITCENATGHAEAGHTAHRATAAASAE
jgi:hypothetical protein